MAQTRKLIDTLKVSLKAHGLTYRDVAAKLELSEASVKRMFASGGFSLERLEQVCQLMEMEISDLVQLMVGRSGQLEELTDEQEAELAGDELLLLVAMCVLDRYEFDDILTHYDIEPTTLIRKLARLDKLHLIDLLPHNRIKPLVSPNFKWRENGPIQRYFLANVEREFFDSSFDRPNERLLSLSGMLSDPSNQALQRKMARLADEFTTLHRDDRSLSLPDKHGTTLVVAVRQWEYGLFKRYRRT